MSNGFERVLRRRTNRVAAKHAEDSFGEPLFARGRLVVFFPFREGPERMLLGRRALPVDELDLVHWASPCTKKNDDP